MTGTSLDGLDIAELETDGITVAACGPAAGFPLDREVRALIEAAIAAGRDWPRDAAPPTAFDQAASAVADEHFRAASVFLSERGLSWSRYHCIGVHGQTVLHERPSPGGQLGRTVQLLDAERLASLCGLPVVHDFRSADVAAGGEGAPLVPVYHAALAHSLPLSELPAEESAAVLNVGGVANVTFLPHPRREGASVASDLVAFDTGPGNGLVDSLVQEHVLGRCDWGGELALRGTVDEAALDVLISAPYFSAPPPKSLDRYAFSLEPVAHLGVADAAATLTAFTALAVARAFEHAPRVGQPYTTLIVCGGGRHNAALMSALGTCLGAQGVRVVSADAVGWRGDAVEAEAFAFLAARTLRGLPLSFPGTTGVPHPILGGRVVFPAIPPVTAALPVSLPSEPPATGLSASVLAER